MPFTILLLLSILRLLIKIAIKEILNLRAKESQVLLALVIYIILER
jgi:ACR3 family arsenite efflux pump ArsB